MKRLFLPISLFLAVLFAAPVAASAYDWKADMKRDLVTVEDGKMKYSELEICEVEGKSKAIQIQWNAEAPAKGLISRDQFVASVAGFSVAIMAEIAAAKGISITDFFDKVDCKPAEEAIGNVDATVSMIMSKGGMQMRVKGVGGKQMQRTMTWKQVFEEE